MILDDDSDVHDADLAARFEALNDLTPPDLSTVIAPAADTGSPFVPEVGRYLETTRPWLLGGIAAMLLLIVAGVTTVAVNRSADQTITAAPNDGLATAPIDDTDSDDGAQPDETDASSTTASTVATVPASGAGDENAPSLPTSRATTTTTGPSDTDDDAGDPAGTTTPTPSLPPPDPSSTLDPLDTVTTATTQATVPDPDTQTVTVAGLVTEVFSDCGFWLRLNDGEVEPAGPVSCDGGSWVIIDGTRIRTSAGFVPLDLYYDKHPSDLVPGMSAAAIAVDDGAVGLTLRCAECAIHSIKPAQSDD